MVHIFFIQDSGFTIGDKVEAPSQARPIRDFHGRAGANDPLPAAPAFHGKAFFLVDPEELLLALLENLTFERYAETDRENLQIYGRNSGGWVTCSLTLI
ncbi:MAG: hypothetical protein H6847_13460 [Hyphomonas sp.]|jgi:hypothetical protein|nr:hypothetical protein [Hyphomonas sp.]MCC0017764.1 hypothetical protein [Rhodobiaceae bacterium]